MDDQCHGQSAVLTATSTVSPAPAKRSRCDQSPIHVDTMNAPGVMQDGKHNRYTANEKLDAILPATGYAIATPPPGYAPSLAPRKFMATPLPNFPLLAVSRS